MNNRFVLAVALAAAMAAGPAPAADVADQLLGGLAAEGAGPFDAGRGQRMWQETHPAPNGGKPRSCATCHTEDLKRGGRHARTGKAIDPLAPSVNGERLTDVRHVEKWFRRNCKWVLGRECNAQEKGDFLSYIRGQ